MNTINSFVSVYYEQSSTAFLADLKVSSKSAATYKQYHQVLNEFGTWLSTHTEDTDNGITEITPLLISKFKQSMFARGVKNNTVLHYLTMLRAFFKWATENRIYTEQPVTQSLMPNAEQIQHDIPSPDEINLLLSGKQPRYAWHSTMRRNRAIITLFLLSGVRVSELCNIHVGDLDFHKNIIYIDHGKGAKSRYVPFPALAQRHITEYLNERKRNAATSSLSPSSFLFVGDDGIKSLTRQGINKIVSGYVERLTGHKGISPHDLRHAAASLWSDSGAPMRQVQQALGHASIQTTERVYVQILNKSKAAEQISKIFQN